MSVRAKFKLNRVEITNCQRPQKGPDGAYIKVDGAYQYKSEEMRTLHFAPVFANNDPKHENSKFWDASPSGELRLGTVNPEAWQQFELDGEYYLDFTPAPK